MADVFDVLRKDHEEVKRALDELEGGPTAASGADPDLLAVRAKLVEHLIIEESKHEAVEEEYFWPIVREKLPEGDRMADHAIEQEQAAKYVLDDLLGREPDDPTFEELLRTFITDGRDHIEYEETAVWPELRPVLTEEEGQELGTKIEEGKKLAPTRPHPHTPPKPGILKAAGPPVAVTDRVRDAVTGRG